VKFNLQIILFCLFALLIVAAFTALFVVISKRKRLSAKLSKSKIETDRFDILTVSQIYAWYDKNRKKIHSNSKGLLASKEAVRQKNASVIFPASLPGDYVFFQSVFINDKMPSKYRFIICRSVEKKLADMIDKNDGYIIFSDLKKGL